MNTPSNEEKNSKVQEFYEQGKKREVIAERVGGFSWFPSPFGTDQKILAKTFDDLLRLRLGGWKWDLTLDYFTDLDACHQAETALTDEQHSHFQSELRRLSANSIDNDPPSFGAECERRYISAGPELRAEALFRVLVREAGAAVNTLSETSQPNVAQPEP